MTTGGNRLPILAEKISRAHTAARRHASKSLEHAIMAGEWLIEAKEQLKHGEWMPWLRDNIDISDRAVRMYMRLARHKDVMDTKSATVADLTIRAAVAEITTPKWPEKLSERVRAVRLLPLHGHIRIGVREDAAGWDEVWIAPSYQHDSFFYVTHAWTSRKDNGVSMVGSRRPVRADYVSTLAAAHLSMDLAGMTWSDRPFPPWTFNILLFTDAKNYVGSLSPADDEDRRENVEIAQSVPPSRDSVHVKAPLLHAGAAPGPLCALVFAEDDAEMRHSP